MKAETRKASESKANTSSTASLSREVRWTVKGSLEVQNQEDRVSKALEVQISPSPVEHAELERLSLKNSVMPREEQLTLEMCTREEEPKIYVSIVIRSTVSPGHKCSGQLYSLVVLADDEEEYFEAEEGGEELMTPDEIPQISLNALNRANTFQTMRVTGKVGKHELHILIDCGSTDNFLDVNVAKRVGCPVTSTCPLAVGGNKQLIRIQWWLATLGDIKCNFSQFRMEFMYKNKRMTLRGTPKIAMHLLDGKQQYKNFENGSGELLMFCVYPNTGIQLLNAEGNKGEVVLIPELDKVVQAYQDVFALLTELPPQRNHDHRIPLVPNAQPVNIRPYRHPPMQKDAIEVMVNELLDSGVIKPSNSPFASPIVMVKKEDNTWRMCVDYRQLNKNTIKDKFPIPIIEELIEELHGAAIFTKLDLRMYKDNIAKTAFKTHQGHYEFLVMPFGLTNAPSTFQALINEELLLTPSKINAMVEWPTPTNIKQLRGFLWLTGYYRRFIKSFAEISRPLTQLLKKGGYKWSNEAQLAFETLKEAMMKAPVLALPDFTQPFVVETDASGVGVGALLQQKGHPIAYMSKTLSLKHQSLSTYEKEFLAVLLALEKWRGYLLDRHFIIKTDHFSLKYLLHQRITTPTQMKWLPKLIGFDYEVIYKKGSKNGAADALSRVQTSELFSLITTLVTTDLAKKIEDSWVEDGKLQAIIVQLRAGQGERNIILGLRKQVKQFVRECLVCQKYKPDLAAYPGLLQPLHIPQTIWSSISMDFIEGLPKSHNKNVIFVIVDRLSKYAHFITHPFTAAQVAQVFLDNVYKLHGMPESIVSDLDKIFLSTFWKELFTLVQVKL
ncbi:transposon ty3-G gag-pol polyprotein [Tanacetum coccineum]